MKLWEILPQLQEGQEFKINYKGGNQENLVYENGGIRRAKSRTLVSFHDYVIEADYELIPQSVSFEEALKALKEGKTICCESEEYGKERYSLDTIEMQNMSVKHEILEGKWFICS